MIKSIALSLVALTMFCHAQSASVAKSVTEAPNKEKQQMQVFITTSLGNIKVDLYQDKAPLTVSNFLNYVEKKAYDDTIFHRVIPNFMVQGGGFTKDMIQKSTMAPVKNEADNGLKNLRGTLAMARTQIVDSATCQFFINHKDNEFLNHAGKTPARYGYCVFGKVVEGMDVVDKIAAVKTGSNGMHQDVPTEAVVIKSIRKVLEEVPETEKPATSPATEQ